MSASRGERIAGAIKASFLSPFTMVRIVFCKTVLECNCWLGLFGSIHFEVLKLQFITNIDIVSDSSHRNVEFKPNIHQVGQNVRFHFYFTWRFLVCVECMLLFLLP